MLSFRLRRVLVFAFLHYVDGQRRIKDGFDVQEDKGYMKMFPEEVLKEPAVRDAFRKALDMMNRSTDASGLEPPPAPPPPPRFDFSEQKDATRMSDVLASVARQKSFSELLESRCIEKGITFVPVVGKNREGRPLYKIGDLQCYVIRNVIMYSDDGGRSFGPIGLDRLLSLVED